MELPNFASKLWIMTASGLPLIHICKHPDKSGELLAGLVTAITKNFFPFLLLVRNLPKNLQIGRSQTFKKVNYLQIYINYLFTMVFIMPSFHNPTSVPDQPMSRNKDDISQDTDSIGVRMVTLIIRHELSLDYYLGPENPPSKFVNKVEKIPVILPFHRPVDVPLELYRTDHLVPTEQKAIHDLRACGFDMLYFDIKTDWMEDQNLFYKYYFLKKHSKKSQAYRDLVQDQIDSRGSNDFSEETMIFPDVPYFGKYKTLTDQIFITQNYVTSCHGKLLHPIVEKEFEAAKVKLADLQTRLQQFGNRIIFIEFEPRYEEDALVGGNAEFFPPDYEDEGGDWDEDADGDEDEDVQYVPIYEEYVNIFTQFPASFAHLTHLQHLQIDLPHLQTLQNIPANLERLEVVNTELSDFRGLPSVMPNLKEIHFHNWIINYPATVPLRSFHGFPPSTPLLHKIEFHTEFPISFARMPPSFDHFLLEQISPRSRAPTFRFNTNHSPIISLHGLPDIPLIIEYFVRKMMDTFESSPHLFPDSYQNTLPFLEYQEIRKQPLSERSSNWYQNLYNLFLASPNQLATRHAAGDILSKFDQDRIIHEGTLETLHHLIDQIGSHDILAQQLAKRLEINLKIPLSLSSQSNLHILK